MTHSELEVPSLEWFDYEVRAASLRLLNAGTMVDESTWYVGGTLPQRLDETMTHSRLREILQCLALFGYGVTWRRHNGSTPTISRYFERELDAAEAEFGIVPSLHWVDSEPPLPRFEAKVCATTLRLLSAGTDINAMDRWLDDAVVQPQSRLREIAHALVFFSYSALWSYFHHAGAAVHDFLARELGEAEKIQKFAEDVRRVFDEWTGGGEAEDSA